MAPVGERRPRCRPGGLIGVDPAAGTGLDQRG